MNESDMPERREGWISMDGWIMKSMGAIGLAVLVVSIGYFTWLGQGVSSLLLSAGISDVKIERLNEKMTDMSVQYKVDFTNLSGQVSDINTRVKALEARPSIGTVGPRPNELDR